MRAFIWMLIFAAAAGCVPAFAQFQDLLQQAESLHLDRDKPVTLDLQRVPLKDAVEKLSQALEVAMAVEPKLADHKVTVIAHDRSGREVGEGLARAVRAHWRRDGQAFLLEPTPPSEVLEPRELAAELSSAFAAANQPMGIPGQTRERELAQSFNSQQLQALLSKDGLSGASLTPQQRQQVMSLLANRVWSSMSGLPREMGQIDDVDSFTVKLQKTGPTDYLSIRGRTYGFTVPLTPPKPVSVPAQPVPGKAFGDGNR